MPFGHHSVASDRRPGAGRTRPAPGGSPRLILISADGYRADYLDRGHSPVLAGLAADGVRAKGLRPVFPSIALPNHYTIVAGLYPDEHGIVNNEGDPAITAGMLRGVPLPSGS